MPEPEEVPHPCLGSYRRRAGRITDPAGSSGLIYVDVDVACTQVGGHLWWRRWSEPCEVVMLYMRFPEGLFQEAWMEGEDLNAEIGTWQRGEFLGHPYRDDEPTRYQLEWLNDEETARARTEFVGD
ncbi:hypothetical protein [Citricoccus sp.]|uniref:hypothetical protein n=1 Tax=Citricoccus sp. TaxID=1978372 RepID=UPI0028BEA6B8|nr:hypothetical protein [Citricoccus sp.]